MKKNKYFILILLCLLSLSSCRQNDYEIINNFIEANDIEIFNLQRKPICFKELFLTKAEVKYLNINVENDKCLINKEIDLKKIKSNHVDHSKSKSRLSYPVFSNDGKYVYIIVQIYDTNGSNFYKTNIVYKLSKKDRKWNVIDTYKTTIQS